MIFTTPAIVCAVLPHGEAGAVVRALTPDHGLMAGYVRGGRSRRLRPVLQIGNIAACEFRSRVEGQLAALTLELVESRAGLAFDPLAAAALEWLGALIAEALPEAQPFAGIHARLNALLGAMAGADALTWVADLARFELALLADLGFGLDLTHCVATGETHDLAFVSPKSGAAVGRAAGAPWAARLLPLPAFLLGHAVPDWTQVGDALALVQHFLARDLLERRAQRILPARARVAHLVARRALG